MMSKEDATKMRTAMRLIGEVCGQQESWGNCGDCPFDEFCTAINDAYWEHNWHDMHQTFCEEEVNHE